MLPAQAYPKANKLLAIFISFCRLAYPEVADRKAQDGLRPRLATAAFCQKFCPGLAPFMRCFRDGNVNEFRRLQQRHEDSLWRLGLTVRVSSSTARRGSVEASSVSPSPPALQILVASLETLVIRRLVICYVAVHLDVTAPSNPNLRSVKQMLRSPAFQSRWSDHEDAQMQAVIMLFSSKLLKANVVSNDEDPSDLTLVFSKDRAWPRIGRKK